MIEVDVVFEYRSQYYSLAYIFKYDDLYLKQSKDEGEKTFIAKNVVPLQISKYNGKKYISIDDLEKGKFKCSFILGCHTMSKYPSLYRFSYLAFSPLFYQQEKEDDEEKKEEKEKLEEEKEKLDAELEELDAELEKLDEEFEEL